MDDSERGGGGRIFMLLLVAAAIAVGAIALLRSAAGDYERCAVVECSRSHCRCAK